MVKENHCLIEERYSSLQLHCPAKQPPQCAASETTRNPDAATQLFYGSYGLWPKYPLCFDGDWDQWWLQPRRVYFWGFAFSARLATSPASLAARATWKGANVSGQVASHTSALLFFQDITEIPSDLLSSEREIPVGSRREGIFAEASDLLRRLFTAACLGC